MIDPENGNHIILTWEEWVDEFEPVLDPLRPKDADKYGQQQYEFETYDPEYAKLRELGKPFHIWTLISSGNSGCIIEGMHLVDRMLYFLTEKPFKDHKTYTVDKHTYGCAHVLDDDIDLNEQEFDDDEYPDGMTPDITCEDLDRIIECNQAGDDHSYELLKEGQKEVIRSRGCGWPKGAEND